jgi:hypothetical protein
MKYESNESGSLPSWAAEQLPEVNELEANKARARAAELTNQQARLKANEERRRRKAEREARQRETDRKVNSVACEMIRHTYERLRAVSAAPDTTLKTKYLPKVKLTQAWEVIATRYVTITHPGSAYWKDERKLIRGLWLDEDGRLRTNVFGTGGSAVDYSGYVQERADPRIVAEPPAIKIDHFYPQVFWYQSNRRPLKPKNLPPPWVVDLPRDPSYRKVPKLWPPTISPDFPGLPYKLPDQPMHCQQCGPESPLVRIAPEELDEDPLAELAGVAPDKDPHADLLARHLTQLMRRYNAL